MTKRKKTKRQTMMNKTVSIKLDWAPRPPYINFIFSSDGKQVT
jgi:hypothetical protein